MDKAKVITGQRNIKLMAKPKSTKYRNASFSTIQNQAKQADIADAEKRLSEEP